MRAFSFRFFSVLFVVVAACSSASDSAPADPGGDGGGADGGTTDRADGGSSREDGSTSTDGGGNDAATSVPSVAATDVCASSANAICAFLAKCFPKFLEGAWEDPATQCEARMKENCVANHPLNARVRKDDADAYTTCLGALACDDLYGPVWSTKCTPPRLAQSKGAGAACRIDAECTSGACSGTSTKCGQCVTRVAAGAACTDTSQCARGGSCSQKCYVPVGLGGNCDTYNVCGTGLVCEAGKCVKAGAEGATCDSDSDCDLFSFVRCHKSAAKCEKITVLEPNASCPAAFDEGPPMLCTKGSRCVHAQAGQPGTCVPPAKVGEACGPDQPCETFINCRGPSGQQRCVLPTYVSCP